MVFALQYVRMRIDIGSTTARIAVKNRLPALFKDEYGYQNWESVKPMHFFINLAKI